jgi:S-DNA-T family DNA segregation ATPase FtsK/SpoIIIE
MSVVTALLFACLFSYKATDPSLFYYTTHSLPTANWCGAPGAYVASLLYQLFGTASFILVIFCIATTLMIIYDLSFKREWDRLGALIMILLMSSVILSRYYYNGGYCGRVLHTALVYFLDVVGSGVCISAILIMCSILILRSIFFTIITLINKRVFRVIYRYKFSWYHGLKSGVISLLSMVWQVCLGIKNLLDGSTLEQEPSLMNFEYGFEELISPDVPTFKKSAHELTHDHVPKQDVVFVQNNKVAHTQVSLQTPERSYVHQNQEHTIASVPYVLPATNIFINNEKENTVHMNALKQQATLLENKLQHFGVAGKVVAIQSGPVVTLFEYQPDIDAKISKIIALEDDLALALQALSIRIIAPIPGRSVVGFEVANKERREVLLASIMQSRAYQDYKGLLPLVLGKDTIGAEVIVDLAAMPHLLVAGSTGSGKSVALNTMLMSLLCKYSPNDIKLILIDPKRLEFSSYADIAHLLFPIVTLPKEISPALQWVIGEMERRYELLAEYGVRNIHDYRRQPTQEHLPFIVIVIDELADVMMTTGREVEELIARIAQMARAAGIHMIVATQRPSVDVITGLIKVNFPSRISFRVSSKVDSRTILDDIGAEKLLGKGDMLFLNASAVNLQRVHGAYVSDKEIQRVTDHIRAQQIVHYQELTIDNNDEDLYGEDDILYQQVLEFLKQVDDISISLLQRKFRIGYNRSARIIEQLEAKGIVSPPMGGKTRKIIR